MNERKTSLTAKLLEVKPFAFPINSISASLDATKLTFAQREGITYTDIFLDSVPETYKEKVITYTCMILNNFSKEDLENPNQDQEWVQTLSYGSRIVLSRKVIPSR